MPVVKPLHWVASAKRDLLAMPDAVQDTFGFALHFAQLGEKHADAKPLQGFGSAGVLEVVESTQGSTYRAVYVLHCFQKKSVKGIATPKPDMDLIRDRLALVLRSVIGKP